MKLIKVAAFVFLLLVFTIPEETEAIPVKWFLVVAAKLGVRLLKRAYYARCNVRNVLRGISCPSVAFGMGWSRNQAQNAARVYARRIGDPECGRYVGHCKIYRYRGGRGK